MDVQCRTMPGQRPCGLPDCERPECSSRKVVPVPQRIIDIVTDRGIPFRVAYGQRMLNDGSFEVFSEVAFYDARYEMRGLVHQHGQFVNAYDVETLLERERGYGLTLHGADSNWTVDAGTMNLVRSWLINQISNRL